MAYAEGGEKGDEEERCYHLEGESPFHKSDG